MKRKTNRGDLKYLADFLASTDRPEGTLSLMGLRGFLFAVVCSPELAMPSEWMPVVFDLDDEVEFDNMAQGQRILDALMGLYNSTNEKVLAGTVRLPADCFFPEDIDGNFELDSPISHWCRGFARGHEWLSDVWDELVSDDAKDGAGLILMNLSFFASRSLAEDYVKEIGIDEFTFERLAMGFREEFEESMQDYAARGRKPGVSEPADGAKQRPVGRNEPCPCGSGIKYKRCCGGGLN